MTVCLLVTSLCVPVSAAGEPATMLYNGVELPNIDTVWTDKESYPYAMICYSLSRNRYEFYFCGSWSSSTPDGDFSGFVYAESNSTYGYVFGRMSNVVKVYYLSGDSWVFYRDDSSVKPVASSFKDGLPTWCNIPIYMDSSFSSVFFASSDPVDPNAPVGTMEIQTVQPLEDSASFTVFVSGVDLTSAYTLKYILSVDGQEVKSEVSDPFEDSAIGLHGTLYGLTPETTYDLTCVLQKDGVDTSITASTTFTTVAAEADEPVDETQTLSLLSAILSAIKSHADNQEQDNLTIISWLEMSWLRLRHIEQNAADILAYIKDLVPSKEESALKTATAETTKAVADTVFAEDAPTKVTASDVKDVAQIGSAASSMFDSGVSIGSFFDALNNIRFIAFFSQETYDDLNTVQSISTYSRDNESGYVDYYSENLDKIQKFVGGE